MEVIRSSTYEEPRMILQGNPPPTANPECATSWPLTLTTGSVDPSVPIISSSHRGVIKVIIEISGPSSRFIGKCQGSQVNISQIYVIYYGYMTPDMRKDHQNMTWRIHQIFKNQGSRIWRSQRSRSIAVWFTMGFFCENDGHETSHQFAGKLRRRQ